jgi:hypothetical protein
MVVLGLERSGWLAGERLGEGGYGLVAAHPTGGSTVLACHASRLRTRGKWPDVIDERSRAGHH